VPIVLSHRQAQSRVREQDIVELRLGQAWRREHRTLFIVKPSKA
jgi:hypothetical protein